MIKVKQNRLSSLLSLFMALVMCMGMFNITTPAADKEELTAGIYEVPVSLMNAGNIANPSMAASCINGNAVLNVANDGTKTITVNLKAVTVFGITAFSSDWKIYQGDSISSDTINAVVTETDSDGNTTQISFTVPDNGLNGVYVNMTVAAMGMSPDAYIAINYANASAFYTVTYTDGADGNVFENQVTENVMSGTETPEFNGTPSRDGYTFMGWTPEVAETVTDNVTYTANWEKIPEPVNPEQPTEPSKDIKPGEYTVPIVSLTSNAPLEAVKEAFAKAFGDTATVIVAG